MTIIAAVDGEEVPDRVVSVGYDLARDLDEELVVLHVMPQDQFEERQRYHGSQRSSGEANFGLMLAPGVNYGTGRDAGSGDDGYTVNDGQEDAAAVASEVVERTLDEGYEGVSFQGRVGEPVEELLAEADRQDARYLVVGGRKMSPVGKAIFGSNTQSILLNAARPVLTVMKDAGE